MVCIEEEEKAQIPDSINYQTNCLINENNKYNLSMETSVAPLQLNTEVQRKNSLGEKVHPL